MAAPANPSIGVFTGTPSSVNDRQKVQAVASQEVTTFNYSEINTAFAIWQAAEAKRMTARKAYDDAVIAGLDLSYSAQLLHNSANAAATEARTTYYTMVSAYKKQLRNRVAL